MKTIQNITGQSIKLPDGKMLSAHEVIEMKEVPESFYEVPNILIEEKKLKSKKTDE